MGAALAARTPISSGKSLLHVGSTQDFAQEMQSQAWWLLSEHAQASHPGSGRRRRAGEEEEERTGLGGRLHSLRAPQALRGFCARPAGSAPPSGPERASLGPARCDRAQRSLSKEPVRRGAGGREEHDIAEILHVTVNVDDSSCCN
ncbi:unnamed protein product [Rangifer tarandus platyrhynchus]|uniref:Uncharacterized protein n=2 Tax=Rangifer tarandus platyrhynchus TaxID=3082113 RepID=A0ABN8YYB1_RANTA|nr:unnamed protein product [Rangifer tarandus platyrhynchus]CAI9703067.1 unnamed protein product [Rangifer tarandus platyrhynchus]